MAERPGKPAEPPATTDVRAALWQHLGGYVDLAEEETAKLNQRWDRLTKGANPDPIALLAEKIAPWIGPEAGNDQQRAQLARYFLIDKTLSPYDRKNDNDPDAIKIIDGRFVPVDNNPVVTRHQRKTRKHRRATGKLKDQLRSWLSQRKPFPLSTDWNGAISCEDVLAAGPRIKEAYLRIILPACREFIFARLTNPSDPIERATAATLAWILDLMASAKGSHVRKMHRQFLRNEGIPLERIKRKDYRDLDPALREMYRKAKGIIVGDTETITYCTYEAALVKVALNLPDQAFDDPSISFFKNNRQRIALMFGIARIAERSVIGPPIATCACGVAFLIPMGLASNTGPTCPCCGKTVATERNGLQCATEVPSWHLDGLRHQFNVR